MIIEKYRQWRTKRFLQNVKQFAHNHKHYLVIVCDPKDDTMFMSYMDKQVAGVIKDVDGVRREVIKKVLKHSTFESAIDRFLASFMDLLKIDLIYFSDFGKWIDGALFAISKALKEKKYGKEKIS